MLNRPRILVIDDDPMFRNLIAMLLRKDYFVAVASDGSEGFHKALGHPPTVAIIDVQMPEWDGLTTLKAFRSHPILCRTQTMMLTSDASKETVLAAIEAGANDYVIKTSFSKDEFLQKLERLLNPHGPAVVSSSVAASIPSSAEPAGAGRHRDVQGLIDAWE